MSIEKIGMGTKPDPDPFKFEILEINVIGFNTVILARYDGCATFDGKKLMVLEGTGHGGRQTLDPHFIEGHPVIARFIPTKEGRRLAELCAKIHINDRTTIGSLSG
jgi:hypothetical protein